MSVAKRIADEMDGEHILFLFAAHSRHLAIWTGLVSRLYGACRSCQILEWMEGEVLPVVEARATTMAKERSKDEPIGTVS